MTTFRVIESQSTAKGEGKNGAWERFNVILSENGTDQVTASYFSNKFNPPPQPGSQLVGTVERNDRGYFEFKPERKPGAGGGPRGPSHPQDAARMLRCHSQEMALRYVEAKARLGRLEDFSFDDLVKLANRFDSDVRAVQEAS